MKYRRAATVLLVSYFLLVMSLTIQSNQWSETCPLCDDHTSTDPAVGWLMVVAYAVAVGLALWVGVWRRGR